MLNGPRILLESKMSFNSPVISEDDQKNHQGMKRNFEGLNSSDSQTTSMLQETPLENLHLAPQTVLERAPKQGRSKCPRCNSSRMFYCYTCYVPVETVPTGEIPVVKIALIFPGPNSVSINDIPLCLQNKSKKKVGCDEDEDSSAEPVLKCAKTESGSESDLGEHQFHSRNAPLKRIVFIDSTWNQTNKIITDERLQGLLQIELKSRKTCFWRHQKGKPETYLSTIEAIYYFLVDYHKEFLKEKYEGQYDNLLFFFSFMYKLIKNAKSAGKD
uniref:DTW domain-containing protein 1 isoform X5 n=1 Tax=Podarcis muralis TaxID=64176 RepID=UPI00109F49F0|nr:DTW domain-containing protein 1 isoform X5 [Podarcis muralis]